MFYVKRDIEGNRFEIPDLDETLWTCENCSPALILLLEARDPLVWVSVEDQTSLESVNFVFDGLRPFRQWMEKERKDEKKYFYRLIAGHWTESQRKAFLDKSQTPVQTIMVPGGSFLAIEGRVYKRPIARNGGLSFDGKGFTHHGKTWTGHTECKDFLGRRGYTGDMISYYVGDSHDEAQAFARLRERTFKFEDPDRLIYEALHPTKFKHDGSWDPTFEFLERRASEERDEITSRMKKMKVLTNLMEQR